MDDVWASSNYQDWEDHIREHILPMLRDSAATVSLLPSGETDIKFAVELGLSIIMDKPIIALVQPGMNIPRGLANVAAEIVEVDLVHDREGAKRSIIEAFTRVSGFDGRHISLEDIDDGDD